MTFPKHIPAKKKTSSGLHGIYFSVGKHGIKVIKDSYYCIVKEYAIMRLIQDLGYTPKVYGFTFVNCSKKRKLAIVMEHIDGTVLDHATNNFKTQQEVCRHHMMIIGRRIDKKYGVLLSNDWHEGNIIVKKGFNLNRKIDRKYIVKNINKLCRIDFSPQYIDINFEDLPDVRKKWNRIIDEALLKLFDLGINKQTITALKNKLKD